MANSPQRPRGFLSEIQCRKISHRKKIFCDSKSDRCLVSSLRRALMLSENPDGKTPTYSSLSPCNNYFYDILNTINNVDFHFTQLQSNFYSLPFQVQAENNVCGDNEVLEKFEEAVKSLLSSVRIIKHQMNSSFNFNIKERRLSGSENNNNSVCIVENKLNALTNKLEDFQYKIGKSKQKPNHDDPLRNNYSNARDRLTTFNDGNELFQKACVGNRSNWLNQDSNCFKKLCQSPTTPCQRKKSLLNKSNYFNFHDDVDLHKHDIKIGCARVGKKCQRRNIQHGNDTKSHVILINGSGQALNVNHRNEFKYDKLASNPSLNTTKSYYTDNVKYSAVKNNDDKIRQAAGWSKRRNPRWVPRRNNKSKRKLKYDKSSNRNRSGVNISLSGPKESETNNHSMKNKSKNNKSRRESRKSPIRVYITKSTPILYKNKPKKKNKSHDRRAIVYPLALSVHSSKPNETSDRKDSKESRHKIIGSTSKFSIYKSQPRNRRHSNGTNEKKYHRKISPSKFSIYTSQPRNRKHNNGLNESKSHRKISPSKFSIYTSQPRNRRHSNGSNKNKSRRQVNRSPSKISIYASRRPQNTRNYKNKKARYHRRVVDSPSMFSVHSSQPRYAIHRKRKERKRFHDNDVFDSPMMISVNPSAPKVNEMRYQIKNLPERSVRKTVELSVHPSRVKSLKQHGIRYYKIKKIYQPINKYQKACRRKKIVVFPPNNRSQCEHECRKYIRNNRECNLCPDLDLTHPTCCPEAEQESCCQDFYPHCSNLNEAKMVQQVPDNCAQEPIYEMPNIRDIKCPFPTNLKTIRIVSRPVIRNINRSAALQHKIMRVLPNNYLNDHVENNHSTADYMKYQPTLVHMTRSKSSTSTSYSNDSEGEGILYKNRPASKYAFLKVETLTSSSDTSSSISLPQYYSERDENAKYKGHTFIRLNSPQTSLESSPSSSLLKYYTKGDKHKVRNEHAFLRVQSLSNSLESSSSSSFKKYYRRGEKNKVRKGHAFLRVQSPSNSFESSSSNSLKEYYTRGGRHKVRKEHDFLRVQSPYTSLETSPSSSLLQYYRKGDKHKVHKEHAFLRVPSPSTSLESSPTISLQKYMRGDRHKLRKGHAFLKEQSPSTTLESSPTTSLQKYYKRGDRHKVRRGDMHKVHKGHAFFKVQSPSNSFESSSSNSLKEYYKRGESHELYKKRAFIKVQSSPSLSETSSYSSFHESYGINHQKRRKEENTKKIYYRRPKNPSTYIRVGKFKKKHRERVYEYNEENEELIPFEEEKVPDTHIENYSTGTNTDAVQTAAKNTSMEKLIRLVAAVGTNTEPINRKEQGVEASIPVNNSIKPQMKSALTNTERVSTRNKGTDSKPIETKRKTTNVGTDAIRRSLRNKDTNTEQKLKKVLVTTGTDAKPVVKVEKNSKATDPLYYLGQKVKGTNTSPIVQTDVGTETPKGPVRVNRGTSPKNIKVKETHTSYDKVQTFDRGVSPDQRKTFEKGQQFDTVIQTPEVKHALTETEAPPMYGKLVQTSFIEPETRKLLHTKETQTRRPSDELSAPIAVPSKSILRPPMTRNISPPLINKNSPPPPMKKTITPPSEPLQKENSSSSDIWMHLLFERTLVEDYIRVGCCRSPPSPVCGRNKTVLVCERTTSERIKIPSSEQTTANTGNENALTKPKLSQECEINM